jgi:hypothetical protein
LALFITGILGTILIFLLVPYEDADVAIMLALAVLGFCELLALVFGIVGWRQWPGKVAVLGTVALVVLMSLCLWWLRQ